MTRLIAILALCAAPAAAAPLASPRAEADLACAAFLAWRAAYGRPVTSVDPSTQSELFASAMAAESDATGTDMLDLIGSLQDRMRVLQNAYQRAEDTGFATIDGLSISADDLPDLARSCGDEGATAVAGD